MAVCGLGRDLRSNLRPKPYRPRVGPENPSGPTREKDCAVANDQSLESAQTTVGTSALSAVPPLHDHARPNHTCAGGCEREAVHDEGQPAPPLQPNPPSPSADSAPIDRPPQPASDAAGQPSPEPEPGRELRADARGRRGASEQIAGDSAADSGTRSKRQASGGPPSLGWFADGAIPAAQGRYRFDARPRAALWPR